ncbi:MAG: GNAT family N-acetyltransferase [Lachnospira sp.]
MKDLSAFIGKHSESMKEVLEELTKIPSPSFQERNRALYCASWLKQHGVPEVAIDEKNNVIVSCFKKKGKNNVLVLAHLDTVFEKETLLHICKEESKWSCPGIGDDTANVVIMLFLIRYLWETKKQFPYGIIFAMDVCEEGLGNLAGALSLLHMCADEIKRVVAFDLYQSAVYDSCIGSLRFEISVHTQGGHSYLDFGRDNAIAKLAEVIECLYKFPLQEEKGHTTFNVGTIEGGTSVNTIAQECRMLFEFRSTCAEELERGRLYLEEVLKKQQEKGIDISSKLVGERPCMGNVNLDEQRELACICSMAVEAVTGKKPCFSKASTDCNIPLSLGIPAVCVGLIRGGGAHTLEEWVDIDSLEEGLKIGVMILSGLSEDSFVFRNGLTEEEKKEVYMILKECNEDFVPFLTKRSSTFQQNWSCTEETEQGIDAYIEEIEKQNNVLLKRNGKVIAFLSFRTPYTCRELKQYNKICYLTTICILKEYRGQKIAPQIYGQAERYIKDNYPDHIMALRTWSTNAAQLHMMEKLGFDCVARLNNDRGEGIDTVYFVKKPE